MILLTAGAEARDMRGYDKQDGGWQYVLLGAYPYEADGTPADVLWRVLSVENGQALLLSEEVLDVRQVINETDQNVIKARTYRRISAYQESDLYTWMNTEMLDALLSKDWQALLVNGEGGLLYCLTTDQFTTAAYGFNRSLYGENFPDRKAKGTPWYEARGGYVDRGTKTATYWTATIRGKSGYQLQLVGYNGHLSWGAYTRVNVGVRPALTIDLTRCLISGEGTKDDPFRLTLTEEAPYAPSPEDERALTSAPAGETPENAAPEEAAGTDQPAYSAEDAEAQDAPAEEAAPEGEQPQTAPSLEDVLSGRAPLVVELPVPVEDGPAGVAPQDKAEETAPRFSEGTLLLSFIGDLSIGDATQSRAQENSLTGVIDREGYAYPFSLVSDHLKADDYTFANLEVNFTERDVLKSDKKYNMIGKPEFVNVLTQGGVDVVNTVNNHCMDFTLLGYQDTLDTLDRAGINHFGSVYPGTDRGSDILGYAEVNGVKIGMVGYSYPQEYDLVKFKNRFKTLRDQGCDLIVCSLHWGREEHLTSEFWQYKFARDLIDAGADVIWGHHPHVVQPIMFYKGKPILFSTGNFIFGTMSDVDPSTGIFQLEYDLSGDRPVLSLLNVIPCQIGARGDYRPYELTDEKERQKCLNKLIHKKNVYLMTNLPQSFALTGRVTVLPDGTLTDWTE